MTKKTKIWVGVLVVLFAVGVAGIVMYRQAMKKYIAMSKSTEGRSAVRSIYMRARDVAAETGEFPAGKTGPVPPAGSCCKGPDEQCAPDPTLWEAEPWSTLGFVQDMPHRYSVEYEVDPSGVLTVKAIGDLDCDGSFSTFTITGPVEGPEPKVTEIDRLE